MRFCADKTLLESTGSELFQPFMTFEEYKTQHSYCKYMIWGTNLIYVYEGGGQEVIIGGSTKNDLLNKLRAIKRYLYETEEIKRNKKEL